MASIQDNEDELVPFVVAEYIKNPIRAARIEAGVTQSELAQRINVTQEYIKEAEKRNFVVPPSLLDQVTKAIGFSNA